LLARPIRILKRSKNTSGMRSGCLPFSSSHRSRIQKKYGRTWRADIPTIPKAA